MNRSLKTGLIIGGVIAAVLIIVSVVPGFQWGWQWCNYAFRGPGMMGGYMSLMPIIWIALVGLIVWAVIAATQGPKETVGSGHTADSALEILNKRYARGEIDKAEYEARKKDLT